MNIKNKWPFCYILVVWGLLYYFLNIEGLNCKRLVVWGAFFFYIYIFP
jgi:hypothetical protein